METFIRGLTPPPLKQKAHELLIEKTLRQHGKIYKIKLRINISAIR